MNFRQRDDLYNTLDKLIAHACEQEKNLPQITLNRYQLETFKKYNRPDPNNKYYYQNVLIQ